MLVFQHKFQMDQAHQSELLLYSSLSQLTITRTCDLQYCPTKHMWAHFPTKPLQGPKIHAIRDFLINCPVDYCKEPPFIPSPHPTLARTSVLTPTPTPLSLPLPNPSLAQMKPRVPLTTPSSRGCVGVKPTDTPTDMPISHESHEPVSSYSRPPDKKVSWGGTLFPHNPFADVDF